MYRLSRRFRRRFGKDKEEKKDKHALDYVIVLLDGSDLSFNLDKKAKGQELLDLVFKNLDLVEKDYFGLQFMDTHQVSHWLDPLKKIKKQVRIGPPFTLHFRVRFYAAEPQDLSEELTRYHFFLQIKQDISKGKLEVPLKIGVDLTAYSLQSHLGDFEPELHEPSTEYITEFKFIPNQTKELEKEIKKKHQALVGLNPAECEVNFLRIVKNMDFYGIDMHNVVGENKVECQLGLTPRGIWFIKEKEKKALFSWPKITKMAFKKSRFLLEFREDQRHTENFTYTCTSSHDAKHLWKSAIEHHTFFRLVKTASKPARTSSFLKFGSRYRFSGRTEHQAQRDARMSGRKSTKIERTKSERFSRRPTVGYIRVGSRVWGKALNGDFYKGVVTGLGEMLHIKFDNGDTIAHDRTDPECVVFDQTPEMNDLEVGTRVIAHWPGLPAKLSGKVIGIEHGKYYVEYDDGDKHHNTIDQLRILKPPMYFGPGSMRNRRGVRKTESMKVTSLTGKAVITTELPKRSNSNGHVRPEMGPRDTQLSSTSSVDGAPHLTSAAEIMKEAEDGPSESFGASNASDQKKASISDGLPDKRPKNIHLRSASLPGNVRAPRANESELTTSPKADKRAKRNKSFGGMTKTSQAKKPPLEIFSLPETDVDSGITVACERSNSGRASKRNLRTMDLMKTTNETDGGKKEKPSKAKSKEERLRVQLPDRKDSGKRSPTATRPDVRVPPNAPYAPNYLETDLDDERRRPRNYFVDAQRSFTVFIPNDRNKLNHRKRFTHFGGFSASDEKLLQDKDSRIIRKRSSLPDLRTFFNQKEEGNTLEGTENKLPRRNRTHSLNDLAKMSPSNSKQTPLHIDNLSSAKDTRADSPLFSPTLEQSASSNKLVQVTDL